MCDGLRMKCSIIIQRFISIWIRTSGASTRAASINFSSMHVSIKNEWILGICRQSSGISELQLVFDISCATLVLRLSHLTQKTAPNIFSTHRTCAKVCWNLNNSKFKYNSITNAREMAVIGTNCTACFNVTCNPFLLLARLSLASTFTAIFL